MTDHTVNPDYELLDTLELTTPDQFLALSGKARPRIIHLLGQRAATTSQLAEALSLPKGTVGHHLKVLETAGLIKVVRTRQVRAITEKYYGLVARTHRISTPEGLPEDTPLSVSRDLFAMPLRQAITEMAPALDMDDPSTSIISHARIPASKAREFARRLEALSQEFKQQAEPNEEVYGFAAAIYRTDWPEMTEDGRQTTDDGRP